jgi:hypothetical protein
MKDKIEQPAPAVKVVERTRHVFPFSHMFDILDAGERRLAWSVEIPVSGTVLDPALSCGSISGDVVIDAVYNGVVAFSVKLSDGAQRIGKAPIPVKKGDLVEMYVHGSGSAKSVAVSLVVREG